MPWVNKGRTTEAEKNTMQESTTRPSLARTFTISSFLDFGEPKQPGDRKKSHLEDAVAGFGADQATPTKARQPKSGSALPAAEPLPSAVAQTEDGTTANLAANANERTTRKKSLLDNLSEGLMGERNSQQNHKGKKKKKFYGGEERTKQWNSKVLNDVDGVIIRQNDRCCAGPQFYIYAVPKGVHVPVQPSQKWVSSVYQQHTAMLIGDEESDWWEKTKCPMSFQAVIKFHKERAAADRSSTSSKKPEFYIYRPSRPSCCYPCSRTICAKPSLKLLDSHLRTVVSVTRTDPVLSCGSPAYSAKDGGGGVLYNFEVPYCAPAKHGRNGCPFLGPAPCGKTLEVDFYTDSKPEPRYVNSSYFVYSRRWGICLIDSTSDMVVAFPEAASPTERGALIASNMLVRYDVLTEHIERQKLPQKILGSGMKKLVGMGAPEIAEMER